MTRGERVYGTPGVGRPRAGRRRGGAALAAALACAALVSGCGIRATSVPVDAGAAPSRMPCRTASAGAATPPAGSVAVRIYLLCASQLATVERAARLDESRSTRLRIAQELLSELESEPSADERRAGFSSVVPLGLRAGGARKNDPEGTLRLSEQPEDLPAEALAQVVCTFAVNEGIGSHGTVLLGGPGDYAPQGYLCNSETKSRPTDVPTRAAADQS